MTSSSRYLHTNSTIFVFKISIDLNIEYKLENYQNFHLKRVELQEFDTYMQKLDLNISTNLNNEITIRKYEKCCQLINI